MHDLLLHNPSTQVYCLVRRNSHDEALEALRANLKYYELWDEDMAKAFTEKRVVVALGDLAKQKLGLDENTWRQLEEEIDVVYHNGCQVSISYPLVGTM